MSKVFGLSRSDLRISHYWSLVMMLGLLWSCLNAIHAGEANAEPGQPRKVVKFEVLAEKQMLKDYPQQTLHQATMKLMGELGIAHNISLAFEMEKEEDDLFSRLTIDIKQGQSVQTVLKNISKASDCAFLYDEEEGAIRFKLNTAKQSQ